MKKVLCLILALLMVVSVVGCGVVGDNGGTTTEADVTDAPTTEADITDAATTEAPTTDAATTEDVTTEGATTEAATTEGATTEGATTDAATTDATTTDGPTSEPEEKTTLKTGYARVVITPPENVLLLKGKESVADDVYATCLAVDDGEKIALFISLDMQDLMENGNDQIRNKVSSITKVPKENIFIAVTHDHSGINLGAESVWTFNTCTNIANIAKAAINDLSETEMFIGTGDTTGAAWVRRYLMADGSMTSISPGKGGAVKSVSEADASLQVVRFVRDDKKDIVLTNWQGHLAHAVGTKGMEKALSADITHYLRKDIEEADEDTLVIFFAGASGNLNLNPPNEDARVYENYIEVAHAIANETLDVMKDLQKIEAGKINITRQTYKAKNAVDSDEDIKAAQARLKEDEISPRSAVDSALDRYMVARSKNEYSNLRMAAVSIGELGLVTAPYEMFDNNGMQIKTQSPFKMTIVITNSDGAFAYIPSREAFDEYGGYETHATYFASGMGEELVAEFLKMLGIVKAMG